MPTRTPGLCTRAAPLEPATLNAEARTVQVTWTTGARVLRGTFDRFYEELSLDPKHVRMDRLNSGAPVLDSHNGDGLASVIGVVESARLEKDRGVAVLRFDRGAAGEDAWRKISDGIVRNVSVGYRVHKMEKIMDGDGETPVYRAVDWEPAELSMVPVGADAQAQVREEQRMDPLIENDDTNAERQRGLAIRDLAKRARLGDAWADNLITTGATVEAARAAAFDKLVADDEKTRIDGTLRIAAGSDRDNRIDLMAEALAARAGGPAPSDAARQYMGLSMADLARVCVEARGQSTRMLSKSRIVELAMRGGYHTVGDFPNLLAGAGNRVLRNAYDSYAGGLRRACRQTSAPDFRPLQRLAIAMGVGPANVTNTLLQKVNEHAEFKRVTANESKEAYSVETFGRIFALSRQAIVNDDLGAFSDMSVKLGRAAAEFVAVQLVALLVSNPTLATDSTAVFHTNHGNLAGTAAAISVTSLGVALKSMRLQKSLDNVTAIDVTPRFLVVPATQEVLARQVLTSIVPAQTSNVNPFSAMLELIVEPRLDASSTTAWYLAADPALIDTVEYAFLDGADGPQLSLQEGWNVDGIEWKVRMDFGAGILDFRGLFKNTGA